ncbi:MAG TPA: BTAD domain-containing putative transcriptional regulator [Acidimicrobiales bacterium]
MDIRLLGSLELVDDSGTDIALSGAKLRGLLALLALRPGQVVSTDRLVEDLWGEDPPSGAVNSLQVLVSKLRKVLPAGAVGTKSPGYLLDVDAETVDLGRFARLTARGRDALLAGDAEKASSLFSEALALWRGEALAEFVYDEFALAEIARLTEERQSVLEDRVDADLACGRHSELIGELEEAVSAEPLRERRRAQLMLALYRSGRQADALRQFQDARKVLGEELGLDPGAELRRLESAMLAQDPSLDPPPRPSVQLMLSRRRGSDLPVPLTPTIGRDDDLVDLDRAVRANRLVTVVGPGGVGKTRLAIEAARSLRDGFEHGVWLVELARTAPGESAIPAVITTLGVPDPPGGAASRDGGVSRLAEFFSSKDALLVLDNCEHVIESAATLAEKLLRECDHLKILATSREHLGVPGEHLWLAQPLATDAAVALFAQRASAANPGFALTDDIELTVEDICGRVDGLPLAIELAAARVRAFPVTQIAARLDDRFALLSGGARTALARQQNLRAVVDWSYDLLFEDERRLFERMSVFAGGCDVDAAVGVCADDQLPASDVPDLLARLVDKSVLVADSTGLTARFSMLQTLAEYGSERLEASGEAGAVRERHREWFAGVAGRSLEAYNGKDHLGWVRAVGTEMDNLRSALGSAVDSDDAESALLISGGLGWYWQQSGYVSEGVRWFDKAFGCGGTATAAARCWALGWRKVLCRHAGLSDPGPAGDELVAVAAESDDPEWVGWMQVLLANLALSRGDVGGTTEWFESARAIFAALDRPSGDANVAFLDAIVALLAGDHEASEQNWARLAALARGTGSITAEAAANVALSNFAESRGDYQRATELLQASMRMTAEMGFHARDVTSVVRLANLAGLMGDSDRASALFDEADRVAEDDAFGLVVARALTGLTVRHRHSGRLELAEDAAGRALVLYRAAGFDPGVIGSLCVLGYINEIQGHAAQADKLHREALVAARKLGDPSCHAVCIEGLAGLALLEQDARRSASLLGAASHLRSVPGVPPGALAELSGMLLMISSGMLDDRFDAERIEAEARKRLGDQEFEEAFAAGAEADVEALTRSS